MKKLKPEEKQEKQETLNFYQVIRDGKKVVVIAKNAKQAQLIIKKIL